MTDARTIIAQTETPDLTPFTEAINTSELGPWDYGRAVTILVIAVVVGRIARFLLKRLLAKTGTDDFLSDLIGRILGYVIVAFGFVYALESLGIAVAPILGALGIVGIALAFALQDILENFVAGVILQLRRPFTAGDQITADDFDGTVLEIDARTVTITTPEGERVRLPSASVIKNPIVNHTENGRRRTTLDVGVAYETDLDEAKHIALDAARSVDAVLVDPQPEVFVHTFGDSSIDLAIRFWHAASFSSVWHTRDDVARAVMRAFDDNDIVIPFPQRVIHGATAHVSPRQPTGSAHV